MIDPLEGGCACGAVAHPMESAPSFVKRGSAAPILDPRASGSTGPMAFDPHLRRGGPGNSAARSRAYLRQRRLLSRQMNQLVKKSGARYRDRNVVANIFIAVTGNAGET